MLLRVSNAERYLPPADAGHAFMTTPPRLNETALFRRTLARAIALPVLLLIMLVLIFLWQLNNLLDAAQWVDHADQVIAQTHTLQALLLDHETGLRGYLITGESDFLDPYREAQTSMIPTLGTLNRLVSDTPAQLELIGALRANYDQWLLYARKLIDVRDQGGDYTVIVRQREGKRFRKRWTVHRGKSQRAPSCLVSATAAKYSQARDTMPGAS